MEIQIFTTGGTIDKVYFDASSAYAVGEPQIANILRVANTTVRFHVETLFQKDSLEFTDDDRALIVQRVGACTCERVLITHGTDSMVQTAQSLRMVPDKTIVLVGSLSPARFKGTDAEFNIGFAFAAVQTLPPGVYVAMNGRVFAPEVVEKNRDVNRFEPAAGV
jgi:L-asparaginase